MKKLILFITLFFSLTAISKGQTLLLNENFDYPVGSELTNNGWNVTGSNVTPVVKVTAASITYNDYLSSGIGNEVTLSNSGQDVNKLFTKQTSGTIYFSFLAKVTSATTTGDYFFHTAADPVGSTFNGRVFVKKNASDKLAFGISRGKETAQYSDFIYDLNTTYLIVMRYTIVSGATNDLAALYINPPLNSPEPASGWLTNTVSTTTDLSNVAAVCLRQGSASNAATVLIDGIRVSTLWTDIVGTGGGSPQVNVSPASLNGFTYIGGTGPSAAQSVSVSGSLLTGNIELSVDEYFEMSLAENGTYSRTLSLTPSGGTVNATTVWVRMESGLEAGTYNTNIEITSVGADNKSVSLSGAVTTTVDEPTNHPTNFTASANTTTSVTLAWYDAVPPADAYLIKGNTTGFDNITAPVDGSPVADGSLVKNVQKDIEMHQFTGLTQGTTYYFKIYPYNGSGSSINYKTNGTVPQTTASTISPDPVVTLTGIDPSSSNFTVNSSNNVLYRIGINVQYQSVTLNQVEISTSGIYTSADIPVNGFKLWLSADNAFGGDTQLAELSSATGHGESLIFGSLARVLNPGTVYLFVTANIAPSATLGHTIGAQATANNNFSFAVMPTFSGSTFGAANLHTINPEPEIAKVFISEYIEGSSNNKAIEIVNKGATPIDLSKLTIKLYANGSGTANNTFTGPAGSLNPGEVIVIANENAQAELKNSADYISTVTFYNGDDALEVLYNGVRTDVFGQIGTDPGDGWAVGGVNNATKDKTLIRKLTVNTGNTNYLGSFGTSPENSEWIIKPTDYFTNIGAHGTVFTGAADANWNNEANWDMSLPIATASAVVATSTNHPILTGTSEVGNLILRSGSNLTIKGALTVGGRLVNPNGSNSLIVDSDGGGSGSLLHNTADVDATVKRYLTGNTVLTAYDYHLVSVPLNAPVTTGQFLGSYLYRFDGPTQSWTSMGTSTTTPLPVDQGYMIYYPNPSTTYSFAGKLNNGSFNASTPLSASDHFALVPNPYPSAIDWDAGEGWTKTNIRDAIWIWDPVANQYATYGSHIGVNGGTRYIPLGQSFFVKSSAPAPVLAMNNNVRVHSNQNFFKEGQITENLLRVKTEGNGFSDEIAIYFSPNGQNGLDEADVDKLFGADGTPQIYTTVDDNRPLSINHLPFTTELLMIPLGFELKKDTEVTLQFTGTESFEPTVGFFLEDQFTGNMANLRESSVYQFSHSENADPQRFRLHLSGITGLDDIHQASSPIWSDGHSLFVNDASLSGQQALLEVLDPAGRLIESRAITLAISQHIETKASGVVLVRLSTQKQVFVTKVFIR